MPLAGERLIRWADEDSEAENDHSCHAIPQTRYVLAALRDGDTERRYGCEVVGSPVPIQLWKTVCRLSVRLHDRPGALAAATQFLRQQKINILLSECCSTYQSRAHWDALCDVGQTP